MLVLIVLFIIGVICLLSTEPAEKAYGFLVLTATVLLCFFLPCLSVTEKEYVLMGACPMGEILRNGEFRGDPSCKEFTYSYITYENKRRIDFSVEDGEVEIDFGVSPKVVMAQPSIIQGLFIPSFIKCVELCNDPPITLVFPDGSFGRMNSSRKSESVRNLVVERNDR